MARKILGVFEVFLGIFENTKEKKDRAHLKLAFFFSSSRCCLDVAFPV